MLYLNIDHGDLNSLFFFGQVTQKQSIIKEFLFLIDVLRENSHQIVDPFLLNSIFPKQFIHQFDLNELILISCDEPKRIFDISDFMRRVSNSKGVHKLFECDVIAELECFIADVFEMLSRDEIAYPHENIMQVFF